MNTRQGRIRAAAASAACAAFFSMAAGPVRAHDAHGQASATPASAGAPAGQAAARNRWGGNYFPNVELTTQDGMKVRFYDDLLKGKQVAINLIFTDCKEVCPLETANLVQVHRILGERVGKDIFFYSISIDPERDTPAVLKDYAQKFGAQWLFLTGKPEDIKLIGKKLALIRDRDAATNSHHAAQLMVGDEPNGQWTRNSAVDSPQFLAARIGTFLGWRDTQPQMSYADARPITVSTGQRLFQSKCSACHSIGQGDRLGPDLAGVTARRERAWLTRYIQDPEELRASGDPVATALFHKFKKLGMPNLRLGSSDVAQLISWLEAQGSAPQKAANHSAHQH
jgi:protein SCO1/2